MNAHMAARTVPDMWYGPRVLVLKRALRFGALFGLRSITGIKLQTLPKG